MLIETDKHEMTNILNALLGRTYGLRIYSDQERTPENALSVIGYEASWAK